MQVDLAIAAPFDLALSLEAHTQFHSRTETPLRTLKVGVCVTEIPTVAEIA